MKIRFRFKDAEIKLVPLFILEAYKRGEEGKPIGYLKEDENSDLWIVSDYHEASALIDPEQFLDHVIENENEVRWSEEYGDQADQLEESELNVTIRSIGRHDASVIPQGESSYPLTVKEILSRSVLGDEVAIYDGAVINTFNELTYQLRQLLGGSYKDYKYGVVSTGNTMVIDPETNDRLLLLGPLAEPMKKKLERQNLLITTRIRDEDETDSEAIQARVTELLNGRRTVPIHKMVSILWSEFGSADEDTIADAMIAVNPEYHKDVILMYVDHMRGKGNSHKCKYCGDVVLNNNDPDILCEGCRELFGHTRYSEL